MRLFVISLVAVVGCGGAVYTEPGPPKVMWEREGVTGAVPALVGWYVECVAPAQATGGTCYVTYGQVTQRYTVGNTLNCAALIPANTAYTAKATVYCGQ